MICYKYFNLKLFLFFINRPSRKKAKNDPDSTMKQDNDDT